MYQEPQFTRPLTLPTASAGDLSKALGAWIAQLRSAAQAPISAIDYTRPVVASPEQPLPRGICVLERIREVEALLERAARGFEFWKSLLWIEVYVEGASRKEMAHRLQADLRTIRSALREFEDAIATELDRTRWRVE